MKTKKKLYKVTLEQENGDEGDFCEKVWAVGTDHAIRLAAADMAGDLPPGKERKAFIEGCIANAGPYAADDVACSVKSDIHDLLAGPGGTLTAEAERAKRVIFDLLAAYGAPGCES